MLSTRGAGGVVWRGSRIFCPMKSETEQHERITTRIHANATGAVMHVADAIEGLIRERAREGKRCVLGLATGSTPVPLYRELIRRHREAGLSFANVVTFNLDEYFPISREHRESYHRFMRVQLFDHIDIGEGKWHLPSGECGREAVFAACREYEEAIAAAGGIDIQLLGIGRTGHIGFNEPGSTRDSRTRLVTLDQLTRRDAARDFLGLANVPRHAITMGIGTILEARKIFLLAWGEAKAPVLMKAIEEAPNEQLPASFLQGHGGVEFHIDETAAAALTRRARPWLCGPVEWSEPLTRRAVQWLTQKTGKPILKLRESDFTENGLEQLLTAGGSAYNLNIKVFNQVQHTITGWPGGKPDADDAQRPEKAAPYPKRVLILSAEPVDALLSMGGTLNRLVEQGHTVEYAAMTSGSLALSDQEAGEFARNLEEVARAGGSAWASTLDEIRRWQEAVSSKTQFAEEPPELRELKGAMLRGAVVRACQSLGLKAECVRFLNLPFYEAGAYRRFKPTAEDGARLRAFLEEQAPLRVFIGGATNEPNSVARLCYELARSALDALQADGKLLDTRVWLYADNERGYTPAQLAMAVPLSPDQLERKLAALPRYGFVRDLEQHAADNNRGLAKAYDGLGLAEYEAMEGFGKIKN